MPVRIESQAEPIPGYKLIERIGGGGFGEVWKAEAPGGLHKAIKFVYGDLQTAGDDGARAEQELKALSRVKTVRHPYILSLERYDIVDGQLIIVMELADRNLWDRFKECRRDRLPGIPREELLRYMEETAEALDLMNVEYQLQHLDIKPHNIFLTHGHIKVADFGLVKDLEGMVASVTGGVTPVYAAPETFDGYVSRFCDQYSLAIVYQELLTGQRPFAGTNVRQLILQHLSAVPKLDSLPARDRAAVARALAKSPEERHKSCRDLVRALRGDSGIVPVPARDSTPGASSDGASPGTAMSSPAAAAGPDSLREPAEKSHTPQIDEASSPAVTQCVRPSDSARSIRAESSAAVVDRLKDAQASVPVAEATRFNETRETTGDGVLAPALVVGLGSHGLQVLRCLRREVQGRFSTDAATAALRLLYLDTDADETRAALRGTGGSALVQGEALAVKLNRPSHYLRVRDRRDTRPRLDGWFDKQMLYRITRTQRTGGVRALGRLAFCDNYAAIARRLREELTACAEADRLNTADHATGLGIRRFRPRVYVVANLAGGTGSGMFLDLAYVTRHLLRRLGLGEPDIVGLCFLPAVDRNPGRVVAVGNTFAALTELTHFSEPGRTFVARYDEREGPFRDSSPPFNRCLMLPLTEDSDAAADDSAGRAGDLLCRELFSPLGRAADQRRSELTPPRLTRDPACQAFGMYRFAFPRRDLVQEVARRLCYRLVEQWMSKDSKPLQASVEDWVQEHWSSGELGVEAWISTLQDSVARLLGETPEAAFAAALQSLLSQTGDDRDAPAVLAPELVIDALKGIDQLVGRPGQDSLGPNVGRIPEALDEASGILVAQWGRKLTELVLHLVEEPQYRLAGAEEAIRQVVARLERTIENHEKLASDLATRAAEARARIHAVLRAMPSLPSVKARVAASTELRELLRNYPKWRNQSIHLQTLGRALVGLRGNLTDQLREVNFCRVRLGELLQAFCVAETSRRSPLLDEPTPTPPTLAGGVRSLLPGGCATLEEAVEHIVRDVSVEDASALDRQVQVMIEQQFRALIYVCMSSANVLADVQVAMEQEVARSTEQRINATDVAALFLEVFPSSEQAATELATAYDAAAPGLPGERSNPAEGESCVLVVPATPAGERLQDLARQAVPEAPWVFAPGGDEVIVYREALQVSLADLPQLGPVAQEAYRQMKAVEHFTPHTRTDIRFDPDEPAKLQEGGRIASDISRR
jgi:serine/threonine protein kinase